MAGADYLVAATTQVEALAALASVLDALAAGAVPVDPAAVAPLATDLLDPSWLQDLVEGARGWGGLVVIMAYSFLIAIVLPLPSEVVLAAPLDLGLPSWVHYGVIVLVSSVGKALGSVLAFHLGHKAKESGPVIRLLRRSRFEVIAWSERKTLGIARKYGYGGLAVALCVPGFPDTLSIYAFAVLEEDHAKFAAATFVGSVGRLLLILGVAGSVVAFV